MPQQCTDCPQCPFCNPEKQPSQWKFLLSGIKGDFVPVYFPFFQNEAVNFCLKKQENINLKCKIFLCLLYKEKSMVNVIKLLVCEHFAICSVNIFLNRGSVFSFDSQGHLLPVCGWPVHGQHTIPFIQPFPQTLNNFIVISASLVYFSITVSVGFLF